MVFWKYADKGNSKERSIQKNIMALKAVPDGQNFWHILGFTNVRDLNIIVLFFHLHWIKLLP